jgi:hypothetical protein
VFSARALTPSPQQVKVMPADIRHILTVSTKRLGPGDRDDNFGGPEVPQLMYRSKHQSRLLDHLVGAGEKCWRHFDAECLRRSEIDDQLYLVGA